MSNKNDDPKELEVEQAKEPTPLKAPQELHTDETPTRRVRFLIVNPADFLYLFTKGLVLAKRTQVFEGVPEDALLMSMTVDHVRGGIILVVQSSEYEPIPITQMPPVQEVKIRVGVEGATKKKKR